jgi:hypothetical protein
VSSLLLFYVLQRSILVAYFYKIYDQCFRIVQWRTNVFEARLEHVDTKFKKWEHGVVCMLCSYNMLRKLVTCFRLWESFAFVVISLSYFIFARIGVRTQTRNLNTWTSRIRNFQLLVHYNICLESVEILGGGYCLFKFTNNTFVPY